MIYLDTSVALAELFAEDRRAPESLWRGPLVASRLLEYETWVRVHGRGAGATHGEATRGLLARVSMVELVPPVLARALEPFPAPVRTLDALHLATILYLANAGQQVRLASFDARLLAAAKGMGIPIA